MDPYVYPGTSVLRNLRDFRDAGVLSEFEAEATARRLRQLEHKPLSGAFDSLHLQAIHRHIFQDVFEWAGDFRTVSISKSGDPFASPQHIVSSLDKTCVRIPLKAISDSGGKPITIPEGNRSGVGEATLALRSCQG